LPFETIQYSFDVHPVCSNLRSPSQGYFSGKIRQDASYENRMTAQSAIAGSPGFLKAKPFGCALRAQP
jgi:hypothetical protein